MSRGQGILGLSAHVRKRFKRITLLLTSTLTIMAGAAIAPSLPEMTRLLPMESWLRDYVPYILTIPALTIALTAPFMGFILDKLGRKWPVVAALLLYAIAGTAGMYLNSF